MHVGTIFCPLFWDNYLNCVLQVPQALQKKQSQWSCRHQLGQSILSWPGYSVRTSVRNFCLVLSVQIGFACFAFGADPTDRGTALPTNDRQGKSSVNSHTGDAVAPQIEAKKVSMLC